MIAGAILPVFWALIRLKTAVVYLFLREKMDFRGLRGESGGQMNQLRLSPPKEKQ